MDKYGGQIVYFWTESKSLRIKMWNFGQFFFQYECGKSYTCSIFNPNRPSRDNNRYILVKGKTRLGYLTGIKTRAIFILSECGAQFKGAGNCLFCAGKFHALGLSMRFSQNLGWEMGIYPTPPLGLFRTLCKETVALCNLSWKFVVTQVASEIAKCNMPRDYKVRQEARSIAQSRIRSTFCNNCCNVFSGHCTV